MNNSVRLTLQQGTGAAHRALDQLPRVRRLLSDSLSIADHADTLRGLITAAQTAEAALEGWSAAHPQVHWKHPGLSARGKIDLVALGECSGPLPEAPTFEVRSFAGYVGVLYVLEGSALGGQFIAHQWKSRGHTLRPSRYFVDPSESVTLRWQEFCGWLEAAVPPSMVDEAVAAAVQTFATFHEVMSEPVHSRA